MIRIAIGVPGAGKTSLFRGMLKKLKPFPKRLLIVDPFAQYVDFSDRATIYQRLQSNILDCKGAHILIDELAYSLDDEIIKRKLRKTLGAHRHIGKGQTYWIGTQRPKAGVKEFTGFANEIYLMRLRDKEDYESVSFWQDCPSLDQLASLKDLEAYILKN